MFNREPREKVRLYVRKAKEHQWAFDEAPCEPISELTIQPCQVRGQYSLVDLPPNHQPHWCLVDSGAMLTLIPKEVWEPYHDQIRNLPPQFCHNSLFCDYWIVKSLK